MSASRIFVHASSVASSGLHSPSPAAIRRVISEVVGIVSRCRSRYPSSDSTRIQSSWIAVNRAAWYRAIASARFWSTLWARTSDATSSVISGSRALRSASASRPRVSASASRILMLTSWSLVSTPAELSMKSVLIRPPPREYSTRAAWVQPRLPPSPAQRARTCVASIRTASFVRSPASDCDSDDAFTYVPMPPFHRRSTGACRIAWMYSAGDSDATPSGSPRAARACDVTGIDLSVREYTPPPVEIRPAS